MLINVAVVNVRDLGQRLLVRAEIINAGLSEAFLVVRQAFYVEVIIYSC